MGKIISVIEECTGGTCLPVNRMPIETNLEHFQDENEHFDTNQIFETDNNSGITIKLIPSQKTIFKYFLDGTRRTYKISEYLGKGGHYQPVLAGQIGAAVSERNQDNAIKKHLMKRINIIALPNTISNDDLGRIREQIRKTRHGGLIGDIVSYSTAKSDSTPLENLAIAKIHKEMQELELSLIQEMVDSRKLETDEMLVIDGSLQFLNVKDEYIFHNVIGISKSFNPNLKGILKSKSKEIGQILAKLV